MSQTKIKIPDHVEKAEIPISPSVPDESSFDGNRGSEAASPSRLLTVEDLSTT